MSRNPRPELSYFELQAYVGTTKHMGGLETTVELIDLCHIEAGMVVLDVGCGAGATACYLAKTVGCKGERRSAAKPRAILRKFS